MSSLDLLRRYKSSGSKYSVASGHTLAELMLVIIILGVVALFTVSSLIVKFNGDLTADTKAKELTLGFSNLVREANSRYGNLDINNALQKPQGLIEKRYNSIKAFEDLTTAGFPVGTKKYTTAYSIDLYAPPDWYNNRDYAGPGESCQYGFYVEVYNEDKLEGCIITTIKGYSRYYPDKACMANPGNVVSTLPAWGGGCAAAAMPSVQLANPT